jgi:hypothetical protein
MALATVLLGSAAFTAKMIRSIILKSKSIFWQMISPALT